MFDSIAAALIIGCIVELRASVYRMNRRLKNVQWDLEEHEKKVTGVHTRLPPVICGILAALCMLGASATLPGCGTIRTGQDTAITLQKYLDENAKLKADNEAIKNKSQRERATDAAYIWGRVGIFASSAIIIFSVLFMLFAPAMRAEAMRLATWSAVCLGGAVTIWCLAPVAIWVMYTISALNIIPLGLFTFKTIRGHLQESKP